MTTLRTWIVGALVTALAGCATVTTSFSRTHSAPHALVARPIEQVDVLTAPPARGYIEIGMVNSRVHPGFTNKSDAEIVAAMRREAAIRGCDGLLVNQLQMNWQDSAPCLVYTEQSQ